VDPGQLKEVDLKQSSHPAMMAQPNMPKILIVLISLPALHQAQHYQLVALISFSQVVALPII